MAHIIVEVTSIGTGQARRVDFGGLSFDTAGHFQDEASPTGREVFSLDH